MLESLIRLRLDLDKNSVEQVSKQLNNLRNETYKSFSDTSVFDALKKSANSALGEVRNKLKAMSNAIANFSKLLMSTFQKLFFLKEGFGILTTAAQAFYNNTIGLNDKLERNLIATKGLLVAITQVFANGRQLTDTSEAMKAINEPLKKVLSDLKREGAELITPFSQQVDIFQIVAGQISSIGGGLKDAKNLTLSFAASLDALGLPANQARQEINSLLTATADQNSRLAQMLFGSSQQANAQMRLWKQQGTVIENLIAKMEGLRESAKEATQTVSGIASNIGDQFEQISVMIFEPLMEPTKQFLKSIYDGLEGLRDSVALQVFIQNFKGFIDNITSAWQQFTYHLESKNPFGASLSDTIEKLKYLWLEFTKLVADAKPLFETVGMLLAKGLQMTLLPIKKAIEGWTKIINLIRMAGEAVGLVKEDRTWDTGPVRQPSEVEVRARVLSEEEYNTPERLAAQWQAATTEIKRAYDQAMDQVRLAALRAETEILESTNNTKEGQRQAAMEMAQIAIENAEKRLEIERTFQTKMQEQYNKQIEMVRAIEAEIAKIKEDGITQDEATQLDKLQQRLEKEKSLEESTRKEIQKSREREEKEKQNLIKETQKLEEEQTKQALEAIEMRKKAITAYYDAAIKGQEALAQAIDQENRRIEQQINMINEKLKGLALDKEFEIKLVQDDKSLSDSQKKQKIQEINQKYLLQELRLKEQIFKLEQKQLELAARKQAIEARKAVLAATKQVQQAEADLQAARKQRDTQAIRDAEQNLAMAKEELALAKDQQAFAEENIKIQKKLARIREENFRKEKRNALQEAGMSKEAQELAEQISKSTSGLSLMGTAIGNIDVGIGKMTSSMDKFGGSIANANASLGKMLSLIGKLNGMSLGGGEVSGGVGKGSFGNLLGRPGRGLENLLPGGSGGGGGLPGGASLGNLLWREGSLKAGTHIENVNINFGQAEKATLTGAKSALRGRF